jgi:hypothetical protein
MHVPSEKTLLEAFPNLKREDAKLIRALAKAVDDVETDEYGYPVGEDPLEELVNAYVPETQKYVRSLYSDPYRSDIWRVTVALHAINMILDGFGVEAIGPDVGGPSLPPYEYISMGDPYETTLIYNRKTNSLSIGNWGDIAERHRW